MTAQAITDIKELVGEMPARGCEWPRHACDSQAHWIARCHCMRGWVCVSLVLELCDRHKDEALSIATEAVTERRFCYSCGVAALSSSDVVGPVMPL
ncbi:Uncharacterised protein [Mycobacteroides abscessus subsp. abscessus]|nr:Uncharacterised protein [Mycobacteroides abscessus subsp. abscessus]SID38340.1 Uncharacterised protein [Mycobacteroides abscessus subsp. abscessus]SID54011.1 Uncharacterised protein [Mycobacteroides abscessus subsp. abscessus]SKK54308.1 Uncharacterised protein [Mycobacteroides abscessus subsp. abscessus]SKV09781.1 Uncharacterised protein [Mycobacteroides abscessus subsp. abscessus]